MSFTTLIDRFARNRLPPCPQQDKMWKTIDGLVLRRNGRDGHRHFRRTS